MNKKSTVGISKEEVIQYYTEDEKGKAVLALKAAKLKTSPKHFITYIKSLCFDHIYKIYISLYHARPASFLPRNHYDQTFMIEVIATPIRFSKTTITFSLIAIKSPENIYGVHQKLSFTYFELFNYIEPINLETMINWKKEINSSRMLRELNVDLYQNYDYFLNKLGKDNLSDKGIATGIKVSTEDQKEFSFHTQDENKVKECMSLMGYATSEYKTSTLYYIPKE